MHGSECIAVREALQSVVLSSHSIIIINHSYNTLWTLAKLLAEIYLLFIIYVASLWATSPSPSTLITVSIMLPLYTIIPVPKPPSSPSLLHPVFHLSPLTVYLIQSKLLLSSQNFNPCLWQSCCMPFYNPPFSTTALGLHYIYHCMTDYHFTLFSRTLF